MKLPFATCVVGLHFVLGACAVTIEPTAERHNGQGGGGPSGTGGAPVGTPASTAGGASGSVGAAGNGGGPTSGGASGQGGASGDGGASGTAGTSGGSGPGAGGAAGSAGTGGAPPADAGASDAGPALACPSLTEGWTPYQPTMTLQCEGGAAFCNYTNSGGIETFKIIKNPANVRQRLEQRVHNDYRTGMNQFEGDLRVTSGDGTTVHQVFKFLMLVAYPQNGGELHQHSQTFLASQAFGKWIHVNTIHDTSTGKTDIYFDCVKKTTMNQSPPDAPGGWYDKYGVYNLGGREAQSEWKGVRYFRK